MGVMTVQNYTEGPLVQVDEQRNAILGTPLARALHSALLRQGATYDDATNSFVFEKGIPKALTTAMTRMVSEKAYPVAGTFAVALERWYPELGGRRASVNDRDAIAFSQDGGFNRALKGLAKLEDTVNLEPSKLIMDRNAVHMRGQLQDLGVVYLQEADAYVSMRPGSEAEIASLVHQASIPTALQQATIKTAVNMTVSPDALGGDFNASPLRSLVGDELAGKVGFADAKDADYDRYEAGLIIAVLNEKIGPALQERVAVDFPNIVQETEATINSARIEQIAERAAKILTDTRDAAITEASLGAMKMSDAERLMASEKIVGYDIKTGKVLENGGQAIAPADRQTRSDINLSVARREAAQGRSTAIFDKSQVQKLETDHFEEKAKGNKSALEVLPVPDQHPKAQSLAALGVGLREMHEIGEATFKDWRLAVPGEVVLAPVAAQNRDWIIQRSDKGVGIIHDASILENLVTPKQRVIIETAKELIGDVPVDENNIHAIAQFNEISKGVNNRKQADQAIALAREVVGASLMQAVNAKDGISNKQTPRILEDLRFPITLGTDNRGNTVLEQPDVSLQRDAADPDVAWAIGTDPGEFLNAQEKIAVAKQTAADQRQQREGVKNYLKQNIKEAREIASTEILRRGGDPTKIQFKMPEPTRVGDSLTGEVIGQTRDGSHTILHLRPRPEGRPPKILIVETADLGIGKMEIRDLKKQDHIRFGFERVVDTLVPVGVHRVPSPEQTAALAALQAANSVNIAEPVHERVPERTTEQALQKFAEWHRGQTGFEPHMSPVIIEPQPGVSYEGPIAGFAGKYAIQSLRPGTDGIPQIALHDCDIILKDQVQFVHPNMNITLAYNQNELGHVAPVTITEAAPLKNLQYATEQQLTNELHISNPDLAANIEKGLGIARQAESGTEAEKTAILAKWAGQEIGM
jgi:hypothetical protein